jgi:poly-gamma-glutamate synthesis protein (capsule biosynthesis protein)
MDVKPAYFHTAWQRNTGKFVVFKWLLTRAYGTGSTASNARIPSQIGQTHYNHGMGISQSKTLGQLIRGGLLLLALLSGCATPVLPSPAKLVAPSATTVAPVSIPSTPSPVPTTLSIPTWTPAPLTPTTPPTSTPPPPITIVLDPGAPAALRERISELIASRPADFAWGEPGTAEVTAGPDPALPLGTRFYALVAPFPTTLDGVSRADLAAAWNGVPDLLGGSLFLSAETAAALEPKLGVPPAAAQFLAPAELLEAAWSSRPAWAIVPFEELEPRWKVLRVEGFSPLDKPLDAEAYPLALPIGLKGPLDKAEKVWAALGGAAAGITNRDENRMTVLAMTGVTALVRATAFEMEIQGLTYPGEEVVGVLESADIAHVSNEVSFAADCPYPDPSRQDGNLRFCSADRYIELLDYVGVDVVELTGNHVNDWGTAAFSRTLGIYQERNWGIFGGGANALDASRPLTMTHNGNTIGFVGCNPAGPQFSWATANSPGTAYCSIESLSGSVAELAPQVDVLVIGIQYREFYNYAPTAQQRMDFAALAEAGADIVSGSQGHHVQGFAFPAGHFVHFGLGNLFFDQMDMLGTRQTFVDRHVIYDGRHISTELWTGLIENWARPREMTAAERENLLLSVFAASGW